MSNTPASVPKLTLPVEFDCKDFKHIEIISFSDDVFNGGKLFLLINLMQLFLFLSFILFSIIPKEFSMFVFITLLFKFGVSLISNSIEHSFGTMFNAIPPKIFPIFNVGKGGEKSLSKNTYKNYKGNMKNGLPHGKGTMKIKGGQFNGTWKNGIPQKGTLVKKYGVYTGNLKNGVPNGRGTYESSSAILNGNWKDGKMHGKGKEIKKSTHAQSGYVQYNGNWKNGKMHGTGNYQRLINTFYGFQSDSLQSFLPRHII